MNETTRIEDEQSRDLNPFGQMPARTGGGAMVEVETHRAIAETQAAILLAKKFPRNQVEAMDRILNAFTRPSLAEKAEYAYARGGTEIAGPSIRAAEAIAREWGNISFGIRELSQGGGESEVEAFAWDMETNTRQVKVFKVPHKRYTRSGGNQPLNDPRDIYEMVANQGARRLRACILGVIPGDVTEAAMRQADATLRTKAEVTPERLKALLEKFAEFEVTQEMIEVKIQRRLDAMTPALMVNLGKVYNALKDGIAKVSDHFDPPAEPQPRTSLKERVTGAPVTGVRAETPQERARDSASEAKSNTSANEKGARAPVTRNPAPNATTEELVESGQIVIHDDPPPAHATGGAPTPTSGQGKLVEGSPASATMPYESVLAHAKKAKTRDQVDIVRDVLRSGGYTADEIANINAILNSKKLAE